MIRPALLPYERRILTIIMGFSILIALILLWGDQTVPRVRSFNWASQVIGAEDRAMLFTFSRPMDQGSVEKNLKIDPPLSGKFSWAGRRMAYTLDTPVPYGQAFKIELGNAQDQFQARSISPTHPFRAEFQSRDRAFAYIGVDQDEESRLVLYNLSRQEKQILTPPDLVVMDFKPYPDSDRILFSATDRSQYERGNIDLQIYSVTTGISYNQLSQSRNKTTAKAGGGEVQLLIKSDAYQNLKFDLAPDGKTIVLQRAKKSDPGDSFGLWILRDGKPIEPLKTQRGGDFLITPDSESIIMAQGQGLAVLPLESGAKPLDFLPQFGRVLGLSNDGREAAMIRFNTDYTRSLFLVNSQGKPQELWRTNGSIFKVMFSPDQKILYCLGSQLLPGETYVEEPFLLAIDLTRKPAKPDDPLPPEALAPLLKFPTQPDIFTSLAPDGVAILFDQIQLSTNRLADAPQSSSSQSIDNSQLWVLPLLPDRFAPKAPPLPTPELLPLHGIHPQWLP